jgi:hypothetical protein
MRLSLIDGLKEHGNMTQERAIRAARGFALLIWPWPPADKYPKPSQIMMARGLGQLELFPLEKRKPAAYQLRFPGF